MNKVTGHCLCGAVAYEVNGSLTDTHACHCGQCRRQGGHYVVATSAKRADFTLTEQRGLAWYRSSEFARRGFCRECGSALFWDDDGDEISINVGNMDAPTDLSVKSHIFVDDKGDYYTIDDRLPKFAGHDRPLPTDGQAG